MGCVQLTVVRFWRYKRKDITRPMVYGLFGLAKMKATIILSPKCLPKRILYGPRAPGRAILYSNGFILEDPFFTYNTPEPCCMSTLRAGTDSRPKYELPLYWSHIRINITRVFKRILLSDSCNVYTNSTGFSLF